MSAYNDGGPAFPIPLNEGQSYQGHAPCDGMTLRDYFAAKAMQGVAAGILADGSAFMPGNEGVLSETAYRIADAMLAARGAA